MPEAAGITVPAIAQPGGQRGMHVRNRNCRSAAVMRANSFCRARCQEPDRTQASRGLHRALRLRPPTFLAAARCWRRRRLKSELEGYEAYAARVRYRLMPGVW